MKDSTKIIMALFSASLMLVGGGAMLIQGVDDSYAAPDYTGLYNEYSVKTINLDKGQNFTLNPNSHFQHDDPDVFWDLYQVIDIPDWVTLNGNIQPNGVINTTNGIITGTAPNYDCTEVLKMESIFPDGEDFITITFVVGTGIPSIDFTGLNTSISNKVEGISFTHKVVNQTGVSMTVTGSNTSWINISDNRIYGVPPSVGDYTFNVKIVKDGYNTINETFTITVVGLLVVTNSPLNGAYSWV